MVAKEKSLTTFYRVPVKLYKEEVDAIVDTSSDLFHRHLDDLSEKGFNILAKTIV